MVPRSFLLASVVIGAGTSCNFHGSTGAASVRDRVDDYEGDGTGECSDSIDNDGDGRTDCQDAGCWGSECELLGL